MQVRHQRKITMTLIIGCTLGGLHDMCMSHVTKCTCVCGI